MDINAAVIDKIKELTDAVRAPRTVDTKEPAHVFRYADAATGDVKRIDKEPEPRAHGLTTLESFIELAGAVKDQKHGPALPVIWLGENSVELVIDDPTRRDRAALPLETTPQFKTLESLKGITQLKQADLVRVLRVALAGCLPQGNGLLGLVRNLKFRNDAAGMGNLQHGRESMGKTIEAEVLGTDALPEEVTFHARVFDLPECRVARPVTCALEIDPHTQTFRLTPLPLQLEEALEAELSEIEARIRGAVQGVPLYRGQCVAGQE